MNLVTKAAIAIAVLGAFTLGIGWVGNAKSNDGEGANIGAEVLQLGGAGLLSAGLVLFAIGFVTNRRSED